MSVYSKEFRHYEPNKLSLMEAILNKKFMDPGVEGYQFSKEAAGTSSPLPGEQSPRTKKMFQE